MAVIITKKTNTQTKADYIKQVYKYAEANGLRNACDVIDYAVDDGLNQIYNLVANESPIECVDYDFKNTQVRAVALWIDDNWKDIFDALESAGNLKTEDECEGEEVDSMDGCEGECHDSKEVSINDIKSLIGETLGLLIKVHKMLKMFA